MKFYVLQDREAGNIIDTFGTLEEAKAKVKEFEADDKKEDTFTEDFYEVIECDTTEYIQGATRVALKNARETLKTWDDWGKELEKFWKEHPDITDEEAEEIMPRCSITAMEHINAMRVVDLCENVFPKLTGKEVGRIAYMSMFETDWRALKDIKEKYALTWNELQMLRNKKNWRSTI